MIAMSFRLVLIGAAVSAVVPLAHAQLITHRDISYAIAKTIAEMATKRTGRKDGSQTLSWSKRDSNSRCRRQRTGRRLSRRTTCAQWRRAAH